MSLISNAVLFSQDLHTGFVFLFYFIPPIYGWFVFDVEIRIFFPLFSVPLFHRHSKCTGCLQIQNKSHIKKFPKNSTQKIKYTTTSVPKHRKNNLYRFQRGKKKTAEGGADGGNPEWTEPSTHVTTPPQRSYVHPPSSVASARLYSLAGYTPDLPPPTCRRTI